MPGGCGSGRWDRGHGMPAVRLDRPSHSAGQDAGQVGHRDHNPTGGQQEAGEAASVRRSEGSGRPKPPEHGGLDRDEYREIVRSFPPILDPEGEKAFQAKLAEAIRAKREQHDTRSDSRRQDVGQAEVSPVLDGKRPDKSTSAVDVLRQQVAGLQAQKTELGKNLATQETKLDAQTRELANQAAKLASHDRIIADQATRSAKQEAEISKLRASNGELSKKGIDQDAEIAQLRSGLGQLSALVDAMSKKLDEQAAPVPPPDKAHKKEHGWFSNEAWGFGAAVGGTVLQVAGDSIASTAAADATGIAGGTIGALAAGIALYRKTKKGSDADQS